MEDLKKRIVTIKNVDNSENIYAFGVGNQEGGSSSLLSEAAAQSMIEISNTQPTSDFNKIWIKKDVIETEVPTMEDIEDTQRDVKNIMRTYTIGGEEADVSCIPNLTDGDMTEVGIPICSSVSNGNYAYKAFETNQFYDSNYWCGAEADINGEHYIGYQFNQFHYINKVSIQYERRGANYAFVLQGKVNGQWKNLSAPYACDLERDTIVIQCDPTPVMAIRFLFTVAPEKMSSSFPYYYFWAYYIQVFDTQSAELIRSHIDLNQYINSLDKQLINATGIPEGYVPTANGDGTWSWKPVTASGSANGWSTVQARILKQSHTEIE